MSITKEYAKAQIQRIAGRIFQPTNGELKDLVDALIQVAESDKHAADIIGSFVYNTDLNEHGRLQCPSPGDIIRVGHATRTTELRPVAACVGCGGSGWRIKERDGVSGAARCGCWKPQPKDTKMLAADPQAVREFAVSAKGMPAASGERFRR